MINQENILKSTPPSQTDHEPHQGLQVLSGQLMKQYELSKKV